MKMELRFCVSEIEHWADEYTSRQRDTNDFVVEVTKRHS